MKRTIFAVLAAAICQAHPAMAHMGTRLYPIYELSTHDLPDVHDGSTVDWEYLVPDASLNLLDFEAMAVGDGAAINPDDLTTRVFLGWNGETQRLYFAVERVDDVYINEFEGGGMTGIWRHDGFEIMVDGDHTGGQYNGHECGDPAAEECFQLNNQQAQQYQLVAQAPNDRLIYIVAEHKDWASLSPWADAGGFQYGEVPNYSFIEGFVTPWDELNMKGPEQSKISELTGGRIIGLQVSLPDFDEKPGQYHGWFTVAGQWETWRLAENFVDGLLLCADGDCRQVEVSAVVPDSWARIKASFR
jgi:hypothetical protein